MFSHQSDYQLNLRIFSLNRGTKPPKDQTQDQPPDIPRMPAYPASAQGKYQRQFRGAASQKTAYLTRGIGRLPQLCVLPFLVGTTHAIALMQERLASHFQSLAKIQLLEPPVRTEKLDLALFWTPRQSTDTAHKWFRETLSQACQQLPPARRPSDL